MIQLIQKLIRTLVKASRFPPLICAQEVALTCSQLGADRAVTEVVEYMGERALCEFSSGIQWLTAVRGGDAQPQHHLLQGDD
jgi:hypothetical protein